MTAKGKALVVLAQQMKVFNVSELLSKKVLGNK